MPNAINTIKQLLQSIDGITLVSTIVIAVVGWIVALLIQRQNAKQEHKIEVRYDIYKQLVALHRQVQSGITPLVILSDSILLVMDSDMIPFKLKLEKEHKGAYFPYSEQECLFEGEKRWSDFNKKTRENYSDYVAKYISFWQVVEDWSAALRPLLSTMRLLSESINSLNESIRKNLDKLQNYTNSKGHDWRNWNKGEIEPIFAVINANASDAAMYIDDFMTLVHNQLLSRFFGYKKMIRKTLDPKFKVLTKKGLATRVERNHERKLKEMLKKNDSGSREKTEADK